MLLAGVQVDKERVRACAECQRSLALVVLVLVLVLVLVVVAPSDAASVKQVSDILQRAGQPWPEPNAAVRTPTADTADYPLDNTSTLLSVLPSI